MISEHDRVVLTTDLPGHSLRAGDVGTIVHIYADKRAYEVEFFGVDGHTLEVVTVELAQVRPVSSRDILHAREVPA